MNIVNLDNIIKDPAREYLFSDAHAISQIARFYEKKDIGKIDNILDKEAIKSTMWMDDYEKKERKQAEFLVKGDIPASYIEALCCHSEQAKAILIGMGARMNIIVSPDKAYY